MTDMVSGLRRWHAVLRGFAVNYGPRIFIQGSIALANFVLIQVAARTLATDQFGLYSLMLAVNAIVFNVLFYPICEGMFRFVHEFIRDGRRDELLRTVAMLTAGAGALVAFLAVVVGLIPHVFGLDGQIPVPAVTAFIALYGAGSVLGSYFSATLDRPFYLLSGLGIPAVSAVLTAFWASFAPVTAITVICIQAVVTILVFILCFAAKSQTTVRFFYAIVDARRWKGDSVIPRFLGYAWAFPFLLLGRYFFTYSDRLAVARSFDLHQVGQWSYMYVLTVTLAGVAYSVYYAASYLRVVERLAHQTEIQERQRIVRRFYFVGLLFPLCFLPLAGVYLFFAQPIIHFVFGWRASIPENCMPQIMAAAALYFGSEQLALVGNLYHRQYWFIVPRLLFSLCLLGVLFFWQLSLQEIANLLLAFNAAHFVLVAFICYNLANGRFAVDSVLPDEGGAGV